MVKGDHRKGFQRGRAVLQSQAEFDHPKPRAALCKMHKAHSFCSKHIPAGHHWRTGPQSWALLWDATASHLSCMNYTGKPFRQKNIFICLLWKYGVAHSQGCSCRKSCWFERKTYHFCSWWHWAEAVLQKAMLLCKHQPPTSRVEVYSPWKSANVELLSPVYCSTNLHLLKHK